MPYHLSMRQLQAHKVSIQSVQSVLFCAAVLFKTKLARQACICVLARLSRDFSFASLTSDNVSGAKRLTTTGDKTLFWQLSIDHNIDKQSVFSWAPKLAIRHARSYSNVTNKCNLCLWEKYYIICRPNMATLNNRNELVSSCRHAKKFLLNNVII